MVYADGRKTAACCRQTLCARRFARNWNRIIMELYGIALSVPMSFVASIIYSLIVGKITSLWIFLSRPLIWISSLVLVLGVLEVVAVLTLGVVDLQDIVGTQYYRLHLTLFFLVSPSIVNIMKIQQAIPLFRKWYVIGTACSILTLCIVLLQYHVSESLFGIN